MREHPIAGLAVVGLAASIALVAGASQAAADASTPLYVNNTSGSNCSDSGAGTQAQPYCTISAAVAAVQSGQMINVASGTYNEHVTINKSGTTGNPITLQRQGTTGAVTLSGSDAGITIDGQHDIAVIGFTVSGVTSGSGIALSSSTGITLQNDAVHAASTAAIVGVQLTAVTDSLLDHVNSSGQQMSTAIALDAATARVTIRNASALVNNSLGGPASKGIDIAGSNNMVVDSSVIKSGNLAGIMIESGATNNIVANDYVLGANGSGIYNNGAIGTAITNNTTYNDCGAGIRVDGASSGVSVQNNVVSMDPRSSPACASPSATAVDIGVYDLAVHDTIVDYNTVYQGYTGTPYAWNTVMDLTGFRKASGQAAHDIESRYTNVNIDNGNSGAPGFQSTDYYGRFREDAPAVANTGVGPISYADRGYIEWIVGPTARLAVTFNKDDSNTVTADASQSTPGGAPIASYTFDFGDGSSTVTQSTPVATHRYSQRGTYRVTITVTDTNSGTGTASQLVPPWPDARVVVDFNGDGKIDIAGIDANNDLRLYAGTGVGKLTCGCGLMWPGGGQWGGFKHIVAGDFNGDGKIDIAGIDAYNDLKLYTGDGTGKLTGGGALMWPGGGQWGGFKHIVAGDFNGDGKIDIAGIDAYNDLKLYTGDGTGKLTGGGALMWPGGGQWAGFKHIVAGDFNGDGFTDIAGIDAYNDLKLYTGDGTGKLTGGGALMWPGGGQWGGFKHIVAGDFNGDGKIDIAGIDAYNDLKLYTGDGTGKLTGGGTLMWPGGGQWAGFKQIA